MHREGSPCWFIPALHRAVKLTAEWGNKRKSSSEICENRRKCVLICLNIDNVMKVKDEQVGLLHLGSHTPTGETEKNRQTPEIEQNTSLRATVNSYRDNTEYIRDQSTHTKRM